MDRSTSHASWRWTLLICLLLAAVVRVGWVWSDLPAVVASHFDASGEADGYMTRAQFFIVLGVVSAAVIALTSGAAALTHRIPIGLINLPNRGYWLAPERRDRSLADLSELLSWLTLPTAALLVFVLELTLRANLERRGFDARAFWIGLGLYAAINVLLLARLYRRFRPPKP